MTKTEQSNQAHNLQYVNKLLSGIMDFHSDLYDIPRNQTVTFAEALDVMNWFEATIVDMFESPEAMECQICLSAK